MGSPSLDSKTVRPGSLGMYYRSARRPDPAKGPDFIAGSRRKLIPKRVVIAVAVVAALIVVPMVRSDAPAQKPAAGGSGKSHQTATAPAAALVAAPAAKSTDKCADNTLDKLVLVSISSRHMWACEQAKTVYDAPVITGMTAHESTLTPPGTYHIYGKTADTVLTGSDETGSWNDPVSYWMPFLDNQYGTYGFHDATWRSSNEFGNVSPDSSDASHGCVELPLAASAWLYKWAGVGTAVTIKA